MRLTRGATKAFTTLGPLGAFLLACVGSALAAPPDVYTPDFAFGPGGTSTGVFEAVQSIAVEDRANVVYVYDDSGTGVIYKFSAQGEPEEFTGLGTDFIEGVGVAGADEVQVAVDNSAAGPAKGDIYVANSIGVRIYSPTGMMLGELSAEAGDPWGEPCGVAVDSAGDVYVGLNPGSVNKYTPTTNPVTNTSYVSSLYALSGVCNVVADSVGDAYVDTPPGGPITKYPAGMFNSLGEPIGEGQLIDGVGSTLVVEQATDDVFVDEGSAVAQFEASGEPIRRFAEGGIEGSFGVAVDPQDNRELYASDSGSGQVKAYKLVPITAPVVEDHPPLAGPIGKRQALLTGTVNPDHAETSYQFQYGTSTSYGQETTLRNIPAGSSDVTTAPVLVGDLQPNTTYHYRLTASNSMGTTEGLDHTFTTSPLTLPTVSIGSADDITAGAATLTATINTHELLGTYQLELASSAAGYLPVVFGSLTETNNIQPINITLTSLSSTSTYRYRITATTEDGTGQSQEATFITAGTPGLSATAFPVYPDLTHEIPAPRVEEPKTRKRSIKKKPKKMKRKSKVRKNANRAINSGGNTKHERKASK